MRVRAAHIALAGAVAQAAFVAYTWMTATAAERQDMEEASLDTYLIVAVTLFLTIPAALLWWLDHPRRHGIGRWSALVLGWLGTLSVFWTIQGLFLVGAFIWTAWFEKPEPKAAAGQPA